MTSQTPGDLRPDFCELTPAARQIVGRIGAEGAIRRKCFQIRDEEQQRVYDLFIKWICRFEVPPMENSKVKSSSVSSKDDLADFIDALKEDFVRNSAEWENPTVDKFLDAMAAWVRSMDGYYRNTGKSSVVSPTWSVFADILSAAKTYE